MSTVEKAISEILNDLFESMSAAEKIEFIKNRIFIREVR